MNGWKRTAGCKSDRRAATGRSKMFKKDGVANKVAVAGTDNEQEGLPAPNVTELEIRETVAA